MSPLMSILGRDIRERTHMLAVMRTYAVADYYTLADAISAYGWSLATRYGQQLAMLRWRVDAIADYGCYVT